MNTIVSIAAFLIAISAVVFSALVVLPLMLVAGLAVRIWNLMRRLTVR